MKINLTLLAFGCAALLAACQREVEDMSALESERAELQEKATDIEEALSALRAELSNSQRDIVAIRRSVLATETDTQKLRDQIAKSVEEIACVKDPSRIRKTSLVPGAKFPELALGTQVYRSVVVKSFDGLNLKFMHENGAANVVVPEYLQTKKEFVAADPLSNWQRPSGSMLALTPYSPLPSAKSSPKRKPAARTNRPIPYRPTWPNHPDWPDWYRPIGSSFTGSSMSPLKRSSH